MEGKGMKKKLIKLREYVLQAYIKNEKPWHCRLENNDACNYCDKVARSFPNGQAEIFDYNITVADNVKKSRMIMLLYLDFLIISEK